MSYLNAFYGGLLVGFAAVLMMLFNGRILGIAGILGGVFEPKKNDTAWRIAFVIGMLIGGKLINYFLPDVFQVTIGRSTMALVIAGILVGFGTRMGSGCTSGHGVCGISRLSPRSILATITFILSGMLVVFVINHFLGGVL